MKPSFGKFLDPPPNTFQIQCSNKLQNRGILKVIQVWRTTKYIFESDVKLLVDAFYGPEGKSEKACFDMIEDDCKKLLKHYEEVLIILFVDLRIM